MELIKQIKQAEAQAQRIIEEAKVLAAEEAEKARRNRLKILEKAQVERKKAIEAAIAAAQSEGLAEVEELNAAAEKKRKQLSEKANSKMAGAVARVMDYLIRTA